MIFADDEDTAEGTPSPTMHPQALGSRSAFKKKVVIVGIYGVPGSGKTYMLDQLEQELGQDDFVFYEGSKMIANVVPGGLDAFQKLEEREKEHWRQIAINAIGRTCTESGKVAVVAGHFMFWAEKEEAGRSVCTQNDLDTFTHILYLAVPAKVIAERRLDDAERSRPIVSSSHLQKWQRAEKTQLRHLCRLHGILFSPVNQSPTLLNKVMTLLRDFRNHDEKHNLIEAKSRLDQILNQTLVAGQGQLKTVLVLDADKTLAAEDTGTLFWKKFLSSRKLEDKDCPLKSIFSSPLGYSYTAFRQATLLYEEVADDQKFDALCQDVASAVSMYPELISLLQLVVEKENVGAVIITCGLSRVWSKVLEKEGLSKTVKVIGGGRIADGFVVTAAVKAALTARLQESHKMYVWVFGDSPLDLEMLHKADQAIVVVGEQQYRSKTMDAALLDAIDDDGLRARQVVLPSNASPRLDTTKLPLIQLTDHEFVKSILGGHAQRATIEVHHATDRKAAKLLMTPMRDAKIAGPALREAHRHAGRYLATEFLGDMIGLEEYPITHVQGNTTTGHRLLHKRQTSIVALMRGGEPMALGVNDAFPLAMLVHANSPDNIKLHHLQGKLTLVLVDSVVNSGKTVVQFVEHVRRLHASIRIVIVAGVAQAESVSGDMARNIARHGNLSLVALRLSDNKFTGTGNTDTGNRLFNTTHLP
ncbi:hypothetical protein MMC14_007941 [Varicellaria rhodocarpa]|nr:hypothetical protein [Varicellaria rhodocarpa]